MSVCSPVSPEHLTENPALSAPLIDMRHFSLKDSPFFTGIYVLPVTFIGATV